MGHDELFLVLMRVILSILLFTLIIVAPAQDLFSDIKPILKVGDARQLSAYLNSSIDITIGSNRAPYNRTQAEAVLRDFFRQNPPTDFTILHTGSSKAGLRFAIGNYKSGKKEFSVLIRIRETEKSWLIHEMSFVSE